MEIHKANKWPRQNAGQHWGWPMRGLWPTKNTGWIGTTLYSMAVSWLPQVGITLNVRFLHIYFTLHRAYSWSKTSSLCVQQFIVIIVLRQISNSFLLVTFNLCVSVFYSFEFLDNVAESFSFRFRKNDLIDSNSSFEE